MMNFELLYFGFHVRQVSYLSSTRIPKIIVMVTNAMAMMTGPRMLKDPVWGEGTSSCFKDVDGIKSVMISDEGAVRTLMFGCSEEAPSAWGSFSSASQARYLDFILSATFEAP